nr:aspartic proteinase A1 [Tanacetum cinerariifolium]
MSQQCKTLVNQYGKAIIEMHLSEAQPDKICSQMNLCTFDGARDVSLSSFPTIAFTTGGKTFELTPEQ